MSAGIEPIEIISPWLFETLSGDGALSAMVDGRIFESPYPMESLMPFVVFDPSGHRDVVGVGGTRIDTTNTYIVKAINKGSGWGAVLPIAKRIDALLHNKTVTTAFGSITCVRESVIAVPETVQAIQYRHLGGLYRIRAAS